MNWNNVDLKSDYERNQDFLDGYSFETLLLEISCNLREINKETVLKQFEIELQNRIRMAREIINSNLDNILSDAIEYRNMK